MKKAQDMSLNEMLARLHQIEKDGEAYNGELQDLHTAQAELLHSLEAIPLPEFNPLKELKRRLSSLKFFFKKIAKSGTK